MKRIALIIFLFLIIAALVGSYLFMRKPTDTRYEKPVYELSAVALMKDFTLDEAAATQKYSDKILLITGKISEINLASNTIFLDAADPMATITCSFYDAESSNIQTLKKGDLIQIKGKCTGKLIDVVVNNCVLNPLK